MRSGQSASQMQTCSGERAAFACQELFDYKENFVFRQIIIQ